MKIIRFKELKFIPASHEDPKNPGVLEKGDAVIVPIRAVHKMVNKGRGPVEYIAMGITQSKGGKTVVVE